MSVVLSISDLRKTFKQWFDKVEVLKWVNFEVNEWELFWFLWPNWSWKTTTLKCTLWFLKPTSWEINVFWEDLTKNTNLYKKIWYAPENTYFYDHLNWLEFLIFMWELVWLTKQEAELNWLWLLEKLWLIYAKDKFVKSYSKWMRQRLWLAASLINDPDLIFWDEPMSWLDPLWRVLVKKLMVELKSSWKTIFFNTHILSDVQEVADRFAIIFKWKIISEDDPKKLSISLEEYFKEIIDAQEDEVHIS